MATTKQDTKTVKCGPKEHKFKYDRKNNVYVCSVCGHIKRATPFSVSRIKGTRDLNKLATSLHRCTSFDQKEKYFQRIVKYKGAKAGQEIMDILESYEKLTLKKKLPLE